MQHQAVAVEALDRAVRFAAAVELGIDVVFQQRDLMALQQAIEALLGAIVETDPGGILQAAHEPAGLDRQATQGFFQGVQVEPALGIDGNLHRLELQPLQHLQAGVEGRAFHRHQITGTGQALQSQIQRLQGAVGDHQFFADLRHAGQAVAPGDLPAQLGMTGGDVGGEVLGGQVAQAVGHAAGQARQGKEIRAGKGRAEGHDVRILQRLQHRIDQVAHRDLGAFQGRQQRRRVARPRRLADEIAGPLAGLDQPATLQQVIGLEHRGGADAMGLAGVAHRGQPLAGGEDAAGHQGGELVGESFVALHAGPGQGRPSL